MLVRVSIAMASMTLGFMLSAIARRGAVYDLSSALTRICGLVEACGDLHLRQRVRSVLKDYGL